MRTLILLLLLVALTAAGSINQKNKRGLPYGTDAADGYGASDPVSDDGEVASGGEPAPEPITASGLHLSSEPADTGDAIVEIPAPNLAATVTASYQATEGLDYGSGGRGAESAGDYGGYRASSVSAIAREPVILGRQVGEPFLISVHREVTRKFGIPVAKPYPVPVPRDVYIKIERAIPVRVDRPYEVRIAIPQPVAVDSPYPVPVVRPYPVPVPRPVPYAVPRPVAVPVPHPVPVPVLRTFVAQPQVGAAPVVATAPGFAPAPAFATAPAFAPLAISAPANAHQGFVFGVAPHAAGLASPAIGLASSPAAVSGRVLVAGGYGAAGPHELLRHLHYNT